MENDAPLPTDLTRWALFLNIDGTLLESAPLPGAAVVPPELPGILHCLSARLAGALALVSGRSLEDIDRLFPRRHNAAGSHGLEWRVGGMSANLPRALPDDLVAAIEAWTRLLPGVVVEHKPWSTALYWQKAPEHASALRFVAQAAIRAAPGAIGLIEGDGMFELVPPWASKGSAIERFMRCPSFFGRTPVFLGNDVTDEEVFDVVNRMDGISIHVGATPTAARHRLLSPAQVRNWLAALAGPRGNTEAPATRS